MTDNAELIARAKVALKELVAALEAADQARKDAVRRERELVETLHQCRLAFACTLAYLPTEENATRNDVYAARRAIDKALTAYAQADSAPAGFTIADDECGEPAGLLARIVTSYTGPQESAHQTALAEKQAKIDALMLEYCPEEMTAEQMAEWQRNQKDIGEKA